MKYLFLFLLFSCAGTSSKVQEALIKTRLPGDWKSKDSQESYVTITCDGRLEYRFIKPSNNLFKDSQGTGQIIQFTPDKILEKSPFGYTIERTIQGLPERRRDGLWEMRMEEITFMSFEPNSCL